MNVMLMRTMSSASRRTDRVFRWALCFALLGLGHLGAGMSFADKRPASPTDVLQLAGISQDTGALVRALGHDDPAVRRSAATLLGKRDDAEVIGPLVAHLDDVDGLVRVAIGTSLARLADERGFNQLHQELHDPELRVAVRAADSQCELARTVRERKAGRIVVADALESPEWTVRLFAVKSIRICNEAAEALTLLDRVVEDDNTYVRTSAAVEMGDLELEDDLLVPRFVALLSHEDPTVRYAANRHLEELSSQRRLYLHSAPLEKREAGIRRWQKWWAGEKKDIEGSEP
jgi:hypothetical protein